MQVAHEHITSRTTVIEREMGLSLGKMEETWGSLSGGERQRAAISVALVLANLVTSYSKLPAVCGNPGSGRLVVSSETFHDYFFNVSHTFFRFTPVMILLDEPTSACDAETAITVENALRKAGHTIFMISHDAEQQQRFATKRVVLRDQTF